MAKRKPSKPYSDTILTPAPKFDPDATKFVNALQWTGSAMTKMNALMDHYGIERRDGEHYWRDEDWMLLALNLAMDFVPGFAPKLLRTPQGRKPKPGNVVADIVLIIELGEAERQGKSVANRARQLTLTHKRFKGKKPETVCQRYLRLKKSGTPEHKRARDLIDRLNKSEQLKK